MPNPISVTLDQAAEILRKHRLANPAAVAKYNLATSFDACREDILAFQRKRLNLGDPLPKREPLRSLARSAEVVVAEVKKASVGVGVIADWIGDSLEPVSLPLAEARAAVCVNCPQNADANWIQRLEGWAAEAFHKTMEAKHDLALRTSQDEKLKACQACNCNLPLKVWAPIKHIANRTKPETMAKLAQVRTTDGKRCWIIAETEQ